MDALAVALWAGKMSEAELVTAACAEWSEQCGVKRKPLKKPRKKDYTFRQKTDEEIQMEELMASMEASGMGGMSMYNRDDMES